MILENYIIIANKDGYTSENLFNEVQAIASDSKTQVIETMKFVQEFPKIVLIGGFAVANYVREARPLTPDMDFLTEELEQIKLKAHEEGYMTSPVMIENGSGITIQELNADFLDADDGDVEMNHYVLNTAITQKVAGYSVRVAHPSVLMIKKFIVGRDKDLKDAFMLLKYVNKKETLKHLSNMKFLPKEERMSIKSYLDFLV